MRLFKYLTFVIITVSSFYSCKKNISTTNPPPVGPVLTGPYVYVGGYIVDQTGRQGVYYKNSVLKSITADSAKLDTVKNSVGVASIVAWNGSAYIAAETGGYFKNDSFIAVKNASQIWYLAFAGSNAYTAGYDKGGNLANWTNDSETNLGNTYGRAAFPDEGLVIFGISGIALKGADVLVSGSFSFADEPGSRHPSIDTTPGVYEMVWDNGSAQVLDHNQYWEYELNYPGTAGVAVSGNDVYVAGQLPDSIVQGGYWKNGGWVAINGGKFKPTSAYASGTDVYITGDIYSGPSTSSAVYWKNGNIVTLNGGSVATAITVYGQDVYVLGIDYDNNYVVWKNGGVLQILGSATSMAAGCIAIAN